MAKYSDLNTHTHTDINVDDNRLQDTPGLRVFEGGPDWMWSV